MGDSSSSSSSSSMTRVLLVVLALVAVMYVRAHYRCPSVGDAVQVLQTDLASLSDDVLFEKHPIVITDAVANLSDLATRSSLRLLHVRSSPKLYPPAPPSPGGGPADRVRTASARFTLVHLEVPDATSVEIHHPTTDVGILVVLRHRQTLVLPPRWRFVCPAGACVCELHDTVSWSLRLLGVTRGVFSPVSTRVRPPTRGGTAR